LHRRYTFSLPGLFRKLFFTFFLSWSCVQTQGPFFFSALPSYLKKLGRLYVKFLLPFFFSGLVGGRHSPPRFSFSNPCCPLNVIAPPLFRDGYLFSTKVFSLCGVFYCGACFQSIFPISPGRQPSADIGGILAD